jgi:hypothetical protein
METAAGTGAAAPKIVANVALVGVDIGTSAVLRDCFKQFGIDTTELLAEEAGRLRREKFEACAMPLDDAAEDTLKMIRESTSNQRIVLYGICETLQQAMRFSRYGINAIFTSPVERPGALRVVRATHLLVVHELRRYVRVPLVTSLILETGTERFTASTVEISAGGMSLRSTRKMTVPQAVRATFDLPKFGRVATRAVVCWIRKGEEMVGLRYDPEDERRLRVREWIDDYLGI